MFATIVRVEKVLLERFRLHQGEEIFTVVEVARTPDPFQRDGFLHRHQRK